MNVLTSGDEPDYERRWLEIMATSFGDGEAKQCIERLKVDLLDVTKGTQCGINSEGLPYICLLLQGQKSVMTFLYAYEALVDHSCPEALYTMMHLWTPVYRTLMDQLVAVMDEDVRNLADPFDHGVGR